MRLLLIEDEERLAEALAFILKKQNYGVDLTFDGETGQLMAESDAYDLIILDRMLPRKEGLNVLRDLRKQGIITPVLLLTAKDTVTDRVEGLDAGADDYLIKPFATEELLARIRALARRPSQQFLSEKLQVGDVLLDPSHSEVTIGEVSIKLTLKESSLLELLMRNPGQVITKEQILNRVWGLDSDVEMGNVEIYIHYLRKKLKTRTVKIETVRGLGYSLKEYH
ncbi:response regulator transcription factor [Desulfitobacterium sp.]|uniref:response regulator transcription factor n=1 Tax=Desulfitobacterium sp. TaxID=49981 RepID=UPI002C5249EC|nr:response regulator transcription factor [Desulfitobacterium sp.]HVJ47737.1 response regulator transcription factor [Desulfitobacterium sp.]